MRFIGLVWLIIVVLKAAALISTSWWIVLLWPIPIILLFIVAIFATILMFDLAVSQR